jgi:SAM-dependent methyltransferase
MPEGFDAEVQEGEFFIFKPRALLEHYAGLIEELQPQHILELGIFAGGSTLFFAELARPRRIAAIDIASLTNVRDRLHDHAADLGFGGVVRTFGEVDQANRTALAGIVEESFDGGELDLVVDDCSHKYEPTRASFNELFPRLRPGGAYVIEDWRWAHLGPEHPEGLFPGEVPLTRLLFEIVLAIPGVPGLVTEISVGPEAAVIRRGDARIEPSTFDISASADRLGQARLAPS